MPKLPKAFTRRKSAANALEESFSDVPLHQQSFKVFERTNTGSTDLGKSRPRVSTEPGTEDNIFSGLSNRYVFILFYFIFYRYLFTYLYTAFFWARGRWGGLGSYDEAGPFPPWY